MVYECKGRKAVRVATDSAYKYISLLKMNDKERELVVKTLQEQGVDIDEANQLEWFAKNVGS